MNPRYSYPDQYEDPDYSDGEFCDYCSEFVEYPCFNSDEAEDCEEGIL